MSVFISDVVSPRRRGRERQGWGWREANTRERTKHFDTPRPLNKALLRSEDEIRKDLANMLEKQLKTQAERWSRFGL